jgi:DNA-binding MarR family transcriptional regulator
MRTARVDYVALADLRHYLRRFLQVREDLAHRAGLAPQQYMALLQLKALETRPPATIGALAHRLLVRHHTAVELVDRLVERGMVQRRRGADDRRTVTVHLRPRGEAIMRRLAGASLKELHADGPALLAVLSTLLKKTKGGRR